MATTPWLTSDDLIDIVKKRISFPISENTLSEEDILKFATYELFDSQVPAILEYHEEFFVFTQDMPLETDKVRYQIPDRAIGMALRDVFLRSIDGNLREMTRIAPEGKAYFQQAGSTNNDIYRFYIENDDIVLSNKNVFPNGQGLVVTYYLRPNSLVPSSRAATAKYFTKILTVNNDNIKTGVHATTFTVGAVTLTAGIDFQKGGNSSVTSSNIATALLGQGINATATSNTVTVHTKLQKTTFSTSDSTAISLQNGLGIQFINIPTCIIEAYQAESGIIDFLQTKGGHRTYKIGYELPKNSISGDTINFPEGGIPENFVVGDYICLENESIIPQIPSDLHSLLAEKTCSRILMSIGDQGGLQTSTLKIAELERKQATIIDNRVEGSPIKIVNKFSMLRLQKKTRRW